MAPCIHLISAALPRATSRQGLGVLATTAPRQALAGRRWQAIQWLNRVFPKCLRWGHKCSIIVHVTHTVNITCLGTEKNPHLMRTAAQYHDKYWTSWELTANFGSKPYGSERKMLPVPGAAPGDELRMKVTVRCPHPGCNISPTPRWEVLHAMLETARDNGSTELTIKQIDL